MSNILKLADIVKIKGGKRLPKGENLQITPNAHPYIRVRDMKGKFIPTDELEYVPDHIFPKIKNYIVNTNDVIVSIVGTIGLVSIITEKLNNASQTENCAKLSGLDRIDAEYLYYFLISEIGQAELQKATVGAVQPKLPLYGLENVSIDWKTRTEREEIVKQLNSLDNKIQLNTQINQTLEQIAQALFKSWFVDFDPVRAKVQALSGGLSLEQAELAAMQAISGKTAEELTALSQTQPDRYAELAETAKAFPCEMVEVDGVEVPKGWEVKRIDEVIQKIPVGKKYSSKIAFSEGLVPILDQGRSGVIGYHNDKPGVKASIEDPIIVFANHTCYMRLISYDFSAIQNVFAFKGKECNLYWLYLATLGKQEFVEYKGHFPDFLIKEIIVPPEELTELFGKYVKENFSKIFINDRENSNLAKIRDLLLPKLLNGEV
ncbi:restriction endonuclease subunit S [Haemophilus influenzae]|uniref:restriction endonuclease subunit S n=1 Tax=Haemophilus influenzae TaxID=727 RepID=UPI000DD4189C|nr:restriction endonuclease subunit S [Haemophilus influenzae]